MGRPRQGAILAEKAINGLAGVEEGKNYFDTKVVESGERLAILRKWSDNRLSREEDRRKTYGVRVPCSGGGN